jgi:hypothetical protein
MRFKPVSPLRLAAAALAASLLAGSAVAIAADAPAVAPGDHPERGQHMPAVEQRFGAPTTRYPAVGQPAITRWDYPGMIVYFENDLVLHTVLTGPTG